MSDIEISLSIEENIIEIGLVTPPTPYTGATTITENGTVPTEGKYLEGDLTVAVPLPPSYEGATTITENGTVPTEGKYLETNLIVDVPTISIGNKVRFIDFDGEVLSTQYIINGNDATPPIIPAHTGLIFQEWNNSYEDITADKDIGATYTTSDGKTHLHITLTAVTGLQPTICLYNDDANPIWLNLGDGSADIELTGTGAITHTPTYASVGDYDITVWKITGTFGLGGNSNVTSVIGGSVDAYRQTLTRANIGANCALKTYSFNACRSMVSITIPNGITSIGDSAFQNCFALTSITIPSGVTSIGSSAFYTCRSLTTITIPNGITSIGDSAFQNCFALTSITIPSGVTSIGSSAFSSCRNLTTITIPSGVTGRLGDQIFSDCYSLTTITIPSGVTSIGDGAFSNCYSLTTITIPSGVTSIGYSAFYDCSALTSITIPSGVTSIEASTFQNCFALTSITIPSGVTSIGTSAFQNCFALTSITIPSGVTSIGTSAFQNCYSIVEYHILATTPPTLAATSAFTGINAICKIYVPTASVDTYKTATNWSAYANYIYGE